MATLWSHPTWNIFHTLTANIIEESFDEKFKNECIVLFTKICNAIPCMFCRIHAAEHMKTIHKDEIKTARDLEIFFWKFHNEVNSSTKKELFPEEKLATYKQKNIIRIKNDFKDVLQMYYRNEELSKEFNTFMKENKDKFLHFNKVKEERKDDKVKVKKDDKIKMKKDDKVKVKKDDKIKMKKDDKVKMKKDDKVKVKKDDKVKMKKDDKVKMKKDDKVKVKKDDKVKMKKDDKVKMKKDDKVKMKKDDKVKMKKDKNERKYKK